MHCRPNRAFFDFRILANRLVHVSLYPHSLSFSYYSAPNSTVTVRVGALKLSKQSFLAFNQISKLVDYLAYCSPPKSRRILFCFKHEDSSSEFLKPEAGENNNNNTSKEFLTLEFDQPNHENGVSDLRKARDAVFMLDPWAVPWTFRTVIQVMLLWMAAFWLVGSWIIPFLAYALGFRKESLTYRGQALYSLLTDVAEGLAGIAILHSRLARFRPLSSDWFRFTLQGKWLIEVGLGCLMFPLVNQLSQVNLSLLPLLPSSPVTGSNVNQSIVARDPVAMTLYAVVVSVCAPIWEEIVFRGFLLPSLTRYMPVWSSILVSSVAFALVHFSVQRMLPLIFLGIVLGVVFTRTRNLFASILLHSLWNAFVCLDLLRGQQRDHLVSGHFPVLVFPPRSFSHGSVFVRHLRGPVSVSDFARGLRYFFVVTFCYGIRHHATNSKATHFYGNNV